VLRLRSALSRRSRRPRPRRRRRRFVADDVEVRVQVDFDLAAIVETDLDAVGSSVVAHSRSPPRCRRRVRESGFGGLFERGAGDRLVVVTACGPTARRRMPMAATASVAATIAQSFLFP
jgi:hypothetical protein